MPNTETMTNAIRHTALGAVVAALGCVGFASAPGAETAPSPPNAAPGAAPSGARLAGTWTILSGTKKPREGNRSEGTTYRFEEAGKVTVGGAKQCAYRFEGVELIIDCDGALMQGRVVFPDPETMVWTVAAGEDIRLKKR